MESYYTKYLKYKSKYLHLVNILKGGEKIGTGLFGIVFRPPLRCEVRKEEYEISEYVGKIMTEKNALEELSNSDKVKALDPEGEWSITVVHTSSFMKEQPQEKDYDIKYYEEYPTQLISKFGGSTLKKIINWDEEFPNVLNIDKLPLLIQLIKRTIPIIDKLNVLYFHNDLHLDNIIYNEHDNKLRLIDFGKLTSISDITDIGAKCDFEEFFYSVKSLLRNSNQIKTTYKDHFKAWLKIYPTDCHQFKDALLNIPEIKII